MSKNLNPDWGTAIFLLILALGISLGPHKLNMRFMTDAIILYGILVVNWRVHQLQKEKEK